jgi:NADPH-dependent 2,4-dienoyl-CoA reductase/sulfur reductase-like enzyme
MIMQQKNYWLETVEAPHVPVCELPANVDVAVVGAGFTGLSAARTLAKGGAMAAWC